METCCLAFSLLGSLRPLGNLSRALYFRELLAKTNKSHDFFEGKKKETRRRPPVKAQRLVSDQTYNWTEVMEESRKHLESDRTEQNQRKLSTCSGCIKTTT